MKTLLNFSHPLSAETFVQLRERLGDFEYRQIHCQFDLNARDTLRAQVENIIPEDVAPIDIVAVVPPSLSAAAYWVGQWLAMAEVPAIWMTRTSDLPPTFVLGGVE